MTSGEKIAALALFLLLGWVLFIATVQVLHENDLENRGFAKGWFEVKK